MTGQFGPIHGYRERAEGEDGEAGEGRGDAAIVVAEFAANAVLHARTGFTVTLTMQPAAVRIGVRDDSPLPAAGTSAAWPVAPTHGLGAVAALAARWGLTRRARAKSSGRNCPGSQPPTALPAHAGT